MPQQHLQKKRYRQNRPGLQVGKVLWDYMEWCSLPAPQEDHLVRLCLDCICHLYCCSNWAINILREVPARHIKTDDPCEFKLRQIYSDELKNNNCFCFLRSSRHRQDWWVNVEQLLCGEGNYGWQVQASIKRELDIPQTDLLRSQTGHLRRHRHCGLLARCLRAVLAV